MTCRVIPINLKILVLWVTCISRSYWTHPIWPTLRNTTMRTSTNWPMTSIRTRMHITKAWRIRHYSIRLVCSISHLCQLNWTAIVMMACRYWDHILGAKAWTRTYLMKWSLKTSRFTVNQWRFKIKISWKSNKIKMRVRIYCSLQGQHVSQLKPNRAGDLWSSVIWVTSVTISWMMKSRITASRAHKNCSIK